MKRRRVRSCYHGSKSSESQQSFLAEIRQSFALSNDGRKGYCFVPDWNHAQESHTCHFCHFFLPWLQGHRLLRSRNFATLSMWCNVFSSVLIFFFPSTFFLIASKTEGLSWSTSLQWLQVLYEYQDISSCVRWSCRITGVWESLTL